MAIRPIKSLSKVSDQPILRSFKSCREISLQSLFGNLLVGTMEHLIMYQRGYRLQEFFNYVQSQIPQAHNEDFQMNYQEIYDDLEELFEKKQLKILNSMIFDSTFISFLVNLQEMNEVKDCKTSENEKLHLVEHFANQMKINVMVIQSKCNKIKYCVDEPYACITLFEDNGVLHMLFPYEYRNFEMDDQDEHLIVQGEEDLRKNNNIHLSLASDMPTSPTQSRFSINSPNFSRFSINSPNISRTSANRFTSPSAVELQQVESEKRMALRAQIFRQQRKQVLDKSQSKVYDQTSEEFPTLSRKLSAEDYFIRDKNNSIEEFKYFSFKGDFSVDAKERIRWVKETELLKEEILKREEFRKLETNFFIEEAKVLEIKRLEIDQIIEEKRKFFEEKRKNEERRLEEYRKVLNEKRKTLDQRVSESSLNNNEAVLVKNNADHMKLLEEKRLAEENILEAEAKLQEAFENYEAQKLVQEQKLAEELEKRIEEERILAEERKKEEKKKELATKALEAQKRIEYEAKLERERKEQEDKKRQEEEEEQERLRIEEEQRIEDQKKEEEDRIAKEQLKAQRLLEAKRKRAQEEEENMRLLREKEVANKKKNEEKKQKLLEEKEQKRIEEEKNRKLEEEKRIADENNRKEEEIRLADEKKKNEEEKRLADEKKRKEEEKRLADEKKRKEEERKLADEKKRKEEERKLAEEKKKKEEERKLADEKKKKEEEKKQAELKKQKAEESKKQAVVEEPYEETDNTSYCGGLYCAKCARELKRSNYILKCDPCNDPYLRKKAPSFPPAPQVAQQKSCMNCSAKISKGEEIHCIRCFLQTKIFNEDYSPCTSCIRADKCYWIDASYGEAHDMILCGFCGENKVKESVIVICTNCNDKICLICLRKNTYVTEGICSNCHNRREPSLY